MFKKVILLKNKLGYASNFSDIDPRTREKQEEKLEGLNSNEIKEMFENADTNQDKLTDFEQFVDSLKNIQIIPIKPRENYCEYNLSLY